MQIVESGMRFGDYRPEQVFRIENSQMHSHVGTGVRSVEFILLRSTNKLLFVEAKSSSPKAESGWERYQEFLNEITEKFVHSFNMFCAWYLGRLEDEGEIGTDLKTVTCNNAKFIFILVIKGHKKEWLLPLQEELNQKLLYHCSVWKSRVIVMNDDIAKKYHLIIPCMDEWNKEL